MRASSVDSASIYRGLRLQVPSPKFGAGYAHCPLCLCVIKSQHPRRSLTFLFACVQCRTIFVSFQSTTKSVSFVRSTISMTSCRSRLLQTVVVSVYVTLLTDALLPLRPLKFVGSMDDIGQLSADDRMTFLQGLRNFLRQSTEKRNQAWPQVAIAPQLAVLDYKMRRQRRSMELLWGFSL